MSDFLMRAKSALAQASVDETLIWLLAGVVVFLLFAAWREGRGERG